MYLYVAAYVPIKPNVSCHIPWIRSDTYTSIQFTGFTSVVSFSAHILPFLGMRERMLGMSQWCV